MSTEGLVFRQGRMSDRESIVDFQIRMAKETENLELMPDVVKSGVMHILNNPQVGGYFVCEKDERIIACLLVLTEWSDWRNGEVWWIHSLYVLPEFRRKSVFRLMYEQLKTRVSGNDKVYGIRLYVDKRNEIAAKAYHTLGMSQEHYALFEWLK